MYRLDLYRRDFIATCLAAGLAGTSTLTHAVALPTNAVKNRKILVLGDSLSAEYGLKRGSGWVALLEQKLKDDGLPATMINASISGDTTSGGLSRLGALLKQHQPSHVIIELGANDALRGLPLPLSQDNLTQMTQQAKAAGARVLIIGMQVPPNYGKDYGERFARMFASVAQSANAGLVPFLLKGVADTADSVRLFQADRIHPKEEAHPTMLANVWPELRKILK